MRRGRNEAAVDTAAPSTRRVASLVARDDSQLLPVWWWSVPVAIFVAPMAAIPFGPYGSGTWTTFAVTTAVSGMFGGAWSAWAMLSASSPQDLSGARDPVALDHAWGAFRRFMVRGLFAMTTLAILGCSFLATAAFVLDGHPGQGGWLGGVGGLVGGLVGTAGAVFGVLADRHRRGILELGGNLRAATWERPEHGAEESGVGS